MFYSVLNTPNNAVPLYCSFLGWLGWHFTTAFAAALQATVQQTLHVLL
jgi:hypothetical protein